MIYSIKFHQKLHIFHGNEILITKKFFYLEISLPPNTTYHNDNALEWILGRKQDDWSFSTKITLIFHSHYHHLLSPTKEDVRIIQGELNQNWFVWFSIISYIKYNFFWLTNIWFVNTNTYFNFLIWFVVWTLFDY